MATSAPGCEALSAKVGIGASFVSDGGHGAMPRDEAEIVAQREELLLNRIEELAVIAARKVGAADGSPKEHVADLRQSIRGVDEHHMARGVSRTMQHLQAFLADLDNIALLQPLVWLEIAHRRKSEHPTLVR